MLKIIDKILALIFAFLLIYASVAFAQAPPPSTPPVAAPLDGLSIGLIVAGAGFGIAKMRKKKAENGDNP